MNQDIAKFNAAKEAVKLIKGGMVVDLGAVQAFLPGSQLDVRPITDFDIYIDKEIELRIVKLNEARKNIVVSHKLIIEESLLELRLRTTKLVKYPISNGIEPVNCSFGRSIKVVLFIE